MTIEITIPPGSDAEKALQAMQVAKDTFRQAVKDGRFAQQIAEKPKHEKPAIFPAV